MGGRLLKRWIHQPLNTVEPILNRLDAVDELTRAGRVRTQLAETLSLIGDLERLTTRICTGRATPRDVVTLRGILGEIGTVREHLHECSSAELTAIRDGLTPLPEVGDLIERAIAPDPPLSLADGSGQGSAP
jgi:DNA mismatch repair protein MutS